MDFALIKNNKCVNIIELDEKKEIEYVEFKEKLKNDGIIDDLVILEHGFGIGDSFENGIWSHTSQTWEEIRQQRDNLLSETDWTQLPDCQLSKEKKEQFKQYRQALRDVTETYEYPENVVWPKLKDYLCKLSNKQNLLKLFTKKTQAKTN